MTRAEREAERVKRDVPSDRQRGRTTRMLWRALLAASETDDVTVIVVAASVGGALWMYDRLCDLAAPVGCRVIRPERALELPNGSKIRVWSKEGGRPDMADRLRGTQAVVFEDHR